MDMKMVMATLADTETSSVIRALHDAGYPLTLIDTTGGFLRRGTSTIIAGVEASQVEDVIELINNECAPSVNPFKKRVTVMVIDVEHFEQIP
jgi:uncharacterized protein YaaQ